MLESEKERDYRVSTERGEQMAVPDIEKPYSIPLNWCWLNLLDSFDNKTDSKKKIKQKDYLSEGQYAIVDQGQTLIGGYTNDEFMLFNGKTPIIIFGDHTRCIKYIDFPFAQGADGVKVLSPKDFFDTKAFYYALQSISIPNLGYRRHYPLFKNFYIPLPPMKEQQRIVDRIESLFAKLDEAKEKAQAVVDGFEDRKAAILHKAFTGGLTEKWRRTHMHSSKEWNSIPFEECIDTMQNGIAKRKGTEGEPFIVIRLANLSDDSFIEDDLREIVLDEKEQHNYELHQDDVIMIRVNGSKENVGKQYRVTNQKKWAFCDHLIRIHYTANVVSQYMVYYSKTKQYRQYILDNMVSSAGQNTISRKGLSRLQLPIPSIEEQKEIVTWLDTHFEKENQAIDAAKKVIDQINTMKKTILARAFRGELGTNDPNDENAIELLNRIL